MAKKVGGGFHVRASDDAKILQELAKVANGGSMSGFKKLYEEGVRFEGEVASRFFELLEHCPHKPPKKRGPKPNKPETLARANRLAELDERVRNLCAVDGIPKSQAIERVAQNCTEFSEEEIWNACHFHGSGPVRDAIRQRKAAARRT